MMLPLILIAMCSTAGVFLLSAKRSHYLIQFGREAAICGIIVALIYMSTIYWLELIPALYLLVRLIMLSREDD